MKKLQTLIFFLIVFSAKADYWTQKADFPGKNRDACFSFTIGSRGYVGCGRDSNLALLKSFWEYDPITNSWTQKANFGGQARYFATGFSVLNNGYVCFGTNNSGLYKNDVWQYNPLTNNWIQKLSFPGTERSQAVSFVIQNNAYICCGHTSGGYTNELWGYDPTNDTWTQKVSFPGFPRISPISFTINNKEYLGAGYYYAGNLFYPKDFWEYDPNNNSWLQKSDFAGPGRTQVASFTLSGQGYAGTGDSDTYYFNDFWQYDLSSDQWNPKTNVPGPGRDESISFSIGNKGYVGIGEAITYYPHDFWEYTPDSTTSIEVHSTFNFEFSISPNPAQDFLNITYLLKNGKEKIDLTLSDVNGKIIFQTQPIIINNQSSISIRDLSKGIYFIVANNGKQKAVRKFMKE